MHSQLEEIIGQLDEATSRLDAIARIGSEPEWRKRSAEGGWSAAECVDHLNITSRKHMAALDDGLSRARSSGAPMPARMRKDPVGWMIWKASLPTTRMKARTAPSFQPASSLGRDQVIAEFRALQTELRDRVQSSDGLPIHRIRIISAFQKRIRYSLFSAFSILAVHQLRHLQQAERALENAHVGTVTD